MNNLCSEHYRKRCMFVKMKCQSPIIASYVSLFNVNKSYKLQFLFISEFVKSIFECSNLWCLTNTVIRFWDNDQLHCFKIGIFYHVLWRKYLNFSDASLEKWQISQNIILFFLFFLATILAPYNPCTDCYQTQHF
jgi:hypothetical protein